jgi:hypothetical protein
VETGRTTAFLGLAGAAAWLLGLAAAARATRLPAAPASDSGDGSLAGSVLGSVFALSAGVGVTGLIALLAVPAAAEVMPPAAGRGNQPVVSLTAILASGSPGISTATGGWAAALLGGPLVLLGAAAAAAAQVVRRRRGRVRLFELGLLQGGGSAPGRARADGTVAAVAPSPPEPLFTLPLASLAQRGVQLLTAAHLPEQYRSLFRPAALEQAAGRARPWFWVVATVALAVAVAR